MLIAVAVFIITCFGWYIKNQDFILKNNECKLYVEKYISCLPMDIELLDSIDQITYEVIDCNIFEKGFFFSEYNKDFICDVILYGNFSTEGRKELKQDYFYQIVMLRLKTLAVLGKEDEYKNLFSEYVYEFENSFSTRFRYKKYWYEDTNFPIKDSADIFNVVVQGFESALENSKNNKTRYIILVELIDLYSSVEGHEDKVAIYKEKQQQLINQNPDVLKNELNEMW